MATQYPLDQFLGQEELFPEGKNSGGKSATTFKELVTAENPEEKLRKYFSDLLSEKFIGRWRDDRPSTGPGEFKPDARGSGETAFQRKIYSDGDGCTELVEIGKVKWIDMEVPVDSSGNSRGSCPDLVGYCKQDSEFLTAIVDLKYVAPGSDGDYRGDNPLLAAFKALYYARAARDNAKNLRINRVYHTNSRVKNGDIKGELLNHFTTAEGSFYQTNVAIVAANAEYWKRWSQHCKDKWNADWDFFTYIPQIVTAVLEDHKGLNSLLFKKFQNPKVKIRVSMDGSNTWS